MNKKAYEVEDYLTLFKNAHSNAISFKDLSTLKKLIVEVVGRQNIREYLKYECPYHLRNETEKLITE